MIEIKTAVRYEYKCSKCENVYIEQRDKEQPQIFTKCQPCATDYELVNETEFTYEVEVADGETL